jgi:hypothetical protein
MALLKRELYRQVKGPDVTHADRCTLVFDTDAKNLFVEREVAPLDSSVNGTIETHTATMDIADYLKQGGQTDGHRELWRLLRTLFKETGDTDELSTSPQRFACRLGTFSNIRLAFNSPRVLSSALIFSIRVIADGVLILRVEFTWRAPSQKLCSAG